MQFYNNLSIKIKISLIAIIGTIGFLIYLQSNYVVLKDSSARISSVHNIHFPIFDQLNKTQLDLLMIKDLLTSAVSGADREMIDAAKEKGNELLSKFDSISKLDPTIKNKIDELSDIFKIYMEAGSEVSIGMLNDDTDFSLLTKKIETYNSSYEELSKKLLLFRDYTYKAFINNLELIDDNNKQGLIKGSILAVVIMLVLIITTLIIAVSLSRDINRIAGILGRMSEGGGDLRTRLEDKGDDELGVLIKNFNQFISKLQSIISETIEVTQKLNVEAHSLSNIAEQTEAKVTAQQNEIFQVSTAVEEMSATSQEVSANAASASVSTQEAKEETGRSRNIIDTNINTIKILNNEMVSATSVINDLNDESKNIGAVLDVIKGIAEQTNLLALNAAIEAARAGEQGRGFAVVADEVRTLAQRTQESTSEIEKIIESLQKGATNAAKVMASSSEQTSVCVQQSEGTNESLNLITQHVNAINDINMQVASAAEEQSAVSGEISQKIALISMSSDQIVEDAKKTYASSSEVYNNVRRLDELVSGFEI